MSLVHICSKDAPDRSRTACYDVEVDIVSVIEGVIIYPTGISYSTVVTVYKYRLWRFEGFLT